MVAELRHGAELLRHEAELLRHEAELFRHAARLLRHTAELLRHTAKVFRHVAKADCRCVCIVCLNITNSYYCVDYECECKAGCCRSAMLNQQNRETKVTAMLSSGNEREPTCRFAARQPATEQPLNVGARAAQGINDY